MNDTANTLYALARAALAAGHDAPTTLHHVRAIGISVNDATWRRVWAAASDDHNIGKRSREATL